MRENSTPTNVGSNDGLGPLYAERDHVAQGEHYTRHVSAMTGESLHAKSAIAAELAHRDMEIERLRAVLGDAVGKRLTLEEAFHNDGKSGPYIWWGNVPPGWLLYCGPNVLR